MREFKFRVWEQAEKEWSNTSMLEVWDNSGVLKPFAWLGHPTENYIIQQYTGLKDKNGKDIFEGDIVSRTVCIDCFKGTTRTDIKEVTFNSYEGYGLKQGEKDLPFGWLWEVIGNIFENPELINEKN